MFNLIARIRAKFAPKPQPKAPDFTEFPAYVLENIKDDEELDDELISRFHDEFQNSGRS